MGKLYEQILEFKILLKKFLKYSGTGVHISCKSKAILDAYKKDVNENKEGLVNKNPDVLMKISLFRGMKFEKIKWDYLYEMYNITLDESEKNLEIVDISSSTTIGSGTASLPKFPPQFGGMESLLGNPAIAGMITELLPVVQETLKNTDTSNIKPENLIKALTSGDLKNNDLGIDLSSVVEKTTKMVNDKVASGDLQF
jgi:hypothetical protein